MRDRRLFELGIAELQRAVRKPYFHCYRMAVLNKKLHAMPVPRYTEDYLQQLMLAASEPMPEFAHYRELARKIPGCARALLAEGRRSEAEAVMDCWKPYARLLVQDDTNVALIRALVARSIANVIVERSERHLRPARRHRKSRGSARHQRTTGTRSHGLAGNEKITGIL